MGRPPGYKSVNAHNWRVNAFDGSADKAAPTPGAPAPLRSEAVGRRRARGAFVRRVGTAVADARG
ncbi:hypothetical protein ATKI12_4241 [Kitasatospora sp. Ki12]|nr:hypothetical protein GCM10018790_15640 [Kitasatospora xanthocidica]